MIVTLPAFASVMHVFTGDRKVPSIRITSRDVRTYFCLLMSLNDINGNFRSESESDFDPKSDKNSMPQINNINESWND